MIHYSCDLCHRKIEPAHDQRYVVKIEVFAALDPLQEGEEEDDRDHLLEVHEALEQLTLDESSELYRELRFDLCPECCRKYAKNPLGREPAKQFNFSEN